MFNRTFLSSVPASTAGLDSGDPAKDEIKRCQPRDSSCGGRVVVVDGWATHLHRQKLRRRGRWYGPGVAPGGIAAINHAHQPGR
jgi:hypothetical protein